MTISEFARQQGYTRMPCAFPTKHNYWYKAPGWPLKTDEDFEQEMMQEFDPSI